jgi:hypothetical protein
MRVITSTTYLEREAHEKCGGNGIHQNGHPWCVVAFPQQTHLLREIRLCVEHVRPSHRPQGPCVHGGVSQEERKTTQQGRNQHPDAEPTRHARCDGLQCARMPLSYTDVNDAMRTNSKRG